MVVGKASNFDVFICVFNTKAKNCILQQPQKQRSGAIERTAKKSEGSE